MTKDDRHDYARMILGQLLLKRVFRHLGWLSKAKNTNPLTENFIWSGKKMRVPSSLSQLSPTKTQKQPKRPETKRNETRVHFPSNIIKNIFNFGKSLIAAMAAMTKLPIVTVFKSKNDDPIFQVLQLLITAIARLVIVRPLSRSVESRIPFISRLGLLSQCELKSNSGHWF